MKNERFEAERAELIQSVKALYIPLSLFLACCIMAAGVFLIYNLEPCGWVFVGVSATLMLTAFIALIRFQNTLRAKGVLVPEDEAGLETQAAQTELAQTHFDPALDEGEASRPKRSAASLGGSPTR
jgi:hypothetical protein